MIDCEALGLGQNNFKRKKKTRPKKRTRGQRYTGTGFVSLASDTVVRTDVRLFIYLFFYYISTQSENNGRARVLMFARRGFALFSALVKNRQEKRYSTFFRDVFTPVKPTRPNKHFVERHIQHELYYGWF